MLRYLPSSLLLLGTNLVPLYGLAFWGWSAKALVVLYWFEALCIGVLTLARMALLQTAPGRPAPNKLIQIPYFAVFYTAGVLVTGQLFFLVRGQSDLILIADGLTPLIKAIEVVGHDGLWLTLAALCASHVFSLYWNYLRGGEYRRARIGDLKRDAVYRALILFMAVFFGALALDDAAPATAAILVVLKTAFDLAAHFREHRTHEPG